MGQTHTYAASRNENDSRDGPDPVLPSRPDKPDDQQREQGPDDLVELVEVLAQIAPVFSRFHTEIGQAEAPRPRSQECVKVKTQLRHSRDAGR